MIAKTQKQLLMALLLASALVLGACSGDNQTTNSPNSMAEIADDAPTQLDDVVTEAAPEMPVAAQGNNPVVVMETSKGSVEIELWADQAPVSVENFLRYVDSNLYNNLTFHRVIPGFMIQGGGFDANFTEISGFPPITNEARPVLRNDRGTLAMARTNVVDSATSQFFINLVDNDFLNQRSTAAQEFGYAVFGQVISGMAVVDDIATVETNNRRQHQNVPVEPVVILSINRR